VRVVSQCLGQTSPMVTMTIYAHVLPAKRTVLRKPTAPILSL
jgi:hypothetical protein